MTTDDERIATAGRAYAQGLRRILGLDGSTVDQAADAALKPGGPNRSDLVARITRRRIDAGLMPESLAPTGT